jgi:hypothetical protein
MLQNETIRLAQLEQELAYSKEEFATASKQRAYAEEIERQWEVEVNSLTNLIENRRRRMGQADTGAAISRDQSELDLGSTLASSAANGSSPHEGGSESDNVNRVDWIYKFTEESGTRGIKPPDVLPAASRVGIKMHKNYPYVVLNKLLERELVVKRRGRYYKKED